MLRSDNRCEYTSTALNEFCAHERIVTQLTVLYTPQQNGAIGRKNRAIVGAMRVMPHD